MSDEKYDSKEEDPDLYRLALAELRTNRALVQRAARAHLGMEDILTDVEVSQNLELATKILEQTDRILDPKISMRENRWFFAAGALIMYTAQFIGLVF